MQANRRSPVVYQSLSDDLGEVAFRLRDGTIHTLSADDARALEQSGHPPRWAHLGGAIA